MTALAKTRRTRAAHPAAKAAPKGPAAFYRPENWTPEESIGYLMKRIIAKVTDAVGNELAHTGLTSAQWVPLLKLHMGYASTVAEVARECNSDVGAMTRTLDRLEAKGLLKRIRSSEDRRVVNLELTAEGRATAKQIPAVLCAVQNAHMRDFTHEEWQLLKGMLRRILDTATELQTDRERNKQ